MPIIRAIEDTGDFLLLAFEILRRDLVRIQETSMFDRYKKGEARASLSRVVDGQMLTGSGLSST